MSGVFDCATCAKRSHLAGSSVRLVFGIKSRVCMGCRQKIDKAAKAPPKVKPPEFVIGANGKRVKLPDASQKLFTIGGPVIPTKVGGYPGYDTRYTPAPDFKGEFSAMKPGQYVADAQGCAAMAARGQA